MVVLLVLTIGSGSVIAQEDERGTEEGFTIIGNLSNFSEDVFRLQLAQYGLNESHIVSHNARL